MFRSPLYTVSLGAPASGTMVIQGEECTSGGNENEGVGRERLETAGRETAAALVNVSTSDVAEPRTCLTLAIPSLRSGGLSSSPSAA